MVESFSKTEEQILEFWQKNKIFEKSLAKKAPKGDYVFYDGPPFATGTPHYGHAVASIMKDVVPRYKTMQGYYVERKWGWDCHGLPVENLIEKELNLKSKQDIENFGVGKFNDACELSVLKYADVWKKFIPRIGRWVDMERDYRTMDLHYMESIWWVFKSLWDKGLIYEDKKSMHICPRCETTLSNFEVTQGYTDLKDISVVVKFKLKKEPDTYVLAWTTTPWTLPGNVALAVGENIDYLLIEVEDYKTKNKERYIFAQDRAAAVVNSLGFGTYLNKEDFFKLSGVMEGKEIMNNDRILRMVKKIKGKDLVGLEYEPLFGFYKNVNLENRENGWKIYPADFISTEEGTGVVHIAPAFGEDDMNLAKQFKLPFIQHVDPTGRFKSEVTLWAGEKVKPKGDHLVTDKKIVQWLKDNGKLFKEEPITHSYPLCWRCDTPLLNYTTNSWFVEVTKIKDKILKNNEKIHWVPESIKHGRFGKWLEGARDWAISRSRFWGDPLPVWRCNKCKELKVVGSIKELEELSGQKIDNLHKHIVDKIVLKCDKCSGEMHRIPEVLDCWFESGSMPYAQVHYPFENKKKFEDNFPAEFIAEGIDQTRGWFYTLMVLSTALFNKPAFKNVTVNGIVLAEDGEKMSKRLKNYPEPDVIIEKYGADSLRYYLLVTPVMKAEDMRFSEKGVDEVYKKLIAILLNVVSFYKMYEGDANNTNTYEYHANKNKNVLDRWIVAKLQVLIGEVTEKLEEYDLPAAARPIQEFVTELSTWYLRRSRDRFKEEGGEKAEALGTMKYVLLEVAKAMAPFTPFIAEKVYREIGGELESVHLEGWPKLEKKLIDKKGLTEMDLTRKIVETGLAARAAAGIKVRQPLASYSTSLAKKLDKELVGLIKDELNVKEIKFGEDKLDTELTAELKAEGLLRELVRQINALRKEMKLTIQDLVKIEYATEDGELKNVFKKYNEELKKSVLASEIVEGMGEKEIKVEDKILKVKII